MNKTITGELIFFGVSILTGVVAAIVFDFFRAVRKSGKGKKVALGDIIFWLCEVWVIFYVLYNFNSGVVRLYFFIGLAAGLVIYFLTISRFVLKIFTAILCVLKIISVKITMLIKKMLAAFFYPFVVLASKTGKILQKIHLKSKKIKKQLKMY